MNKFLVAALTFIFLITPSIAATPAVTTPSPWHLYQDSNKTITDCTLSYTDPATTYRFSLAFYTTDKNGSTILLDSKNFNFTKDMDVSVIVYNGIKMMGNGSGPAKFLDKNTLSIDVSPSFIQAFAASTSIEYTIGDKKFLVDETSFDPALQDQWSKCMANLKTVGDKVPNTSPSNNVPKYPPLITV